MNDLEFLSDNEKSLLLSCINSYLEKIDFILKNSRYYFSNNAFGKSIIDDFKSDRKKLVNL